MLVHSGELDLMFALSEIGCPFIPTNLKTCDAVPSSRVGVERKRYDDFSASIKDGRIFEECANMQAFDKIIVIYEGGTHLDGYHLLKKSVLGTIGTLLMNYNLTIIHTKDEYDTAYVLKSLWESEGRGIKYKPINREKIPKKLIDRQIFLLSSFPKMGFKVAKRLLDVFKTPMNVMNAICNVKFEYTKKSGNIKKVLGEIGQVDKLGPKKIQEWKNLLEKPDPSVLM